MLFELTQQSNIKGAQPNRFSHSEEMEKLSYIQVNLIKVLPPPRAQTYI